MNLKKIYLVLLILSMPDVSFAYLGMGPILPMIGSALIFIFLILIGIIGIFIYPIKKLIERKKKTKNKKEDKSIS